MAVQTAAGRGRFEGNRPKETRRGFSRRPARMPQATRHALELLQETLLGEAAATGAAGVFLTGDDLRYVAVNEAACDILGYERDELLALRVSDVVISDAERLRNASLDVMDGLTLYGTARVR